MVEPNKIKYISLGYNCLPAYLFQVLEVREESYPFDWIFSTPNSIYQILIKLLQEDRDEYDLFQMSSEKIGLTEGIPTYTIESKDIIAPNGFYKIPYNPEYSLLFVHDKNNQETEKKYQRRLKRLRETLLNQNYYLKFVFSPESSGEYIFTIDGKKQLNQELIDIYKITELLSRYRSLETFDVVILETHSRYLFLEKMEKKITSRITILKIGVHKDFHYLVANNFPEPICKKKIILDKL